MALADLFIYPNIKGLWAVIYLSAIVFVKVTVIWEYTRI